jgi:hypothetical protein
LYKFITQRHVIVILVKSLKLADHLGETSGPPMSNSALEDTPFRFRSYDRIEVEQKKINFKEIYSQPPGKVQHPYILTKKLADFSRRLLELNF